MTTRNLFDREAHALRELVTGVGERSTAEKEIEAAFESASAAATREANRERKRVATSREREMEDQERDHLKKSTALKTQHREAIEVIDKTRDDALTTIAAQCNKLEEKAKNELQEAQWAADSIHEANEKEAMDAKITLQRKVAGARERVTAGWTHAQPFLQRVKLTRESLAHLENAAIRPMENALESVRAAFEKADKAHERMEKSSILKWSKGLGAAVVFILLAGAGVGLGFNNDDLMTFGIAGGVAGLVGAIAFHLFLKAKAKKHLIKQSEQMAIALGEAKAGSDVLLEKSEKDYDTALVKADSLRKTSKLHAMEKYTPLMAKIKAKRESENKKTNEKHKKDSDETNAKFKQAIEQEQGWHDGRVKEITADHDRQQQESDDAFNAKMAGSTATRDTDWNAMSQVWRGRMELLKDAHDQVTALNAERFGPWNNGMWKDPPKFTDIPPGIRLGEIKVDMADIPDGVPREESLKPLVPVQTTWPFYVPFPERGTIVFKSKDQAKTPAVPSLQSLMLRFLTAIPAGKVRFTIVDPVGLGDNFASYMNLADFDDQLVAGGRIWTEPRDIERRLQDLTVHMETVIQKYLRNQYKSIEEYNAKAGEVAEPFRVLVVANFPTNFTLEAAKRLVSIASSGATCGVYTLVSIDEKQAMPQGFQVADLEQAGILIEYGDNNKYFWRDPDLRRFPLSIDAAPDGETLTRLVKTVGERSRDANRVEVPFEFVAPKPEEVWSFNSAKGVNVPIGRAGATKRQFMQLGLGTAQHGLIAGKTGSGKSTLMHALITNLALCYDPTQVELYLIDFKKGVEFKVYAEYNLPHARVIAVESEREFGLSVLQRLDAILKDRGERYRDAGCNDLAGYREARPNEPSPRIMLIIDEFQEFFVEDDKLAQEVGLLMDRIVRQGRAFGMHVLLGSQTLGGAYSLARSTIDQMAVRVALQCSEADAQLILSKDNVAARLLSRPGEAIYNDQNGLTEGNDPFQVVWLSEQKREGYLAELHKRADGVYTKQPLVFEGSAAAEIEKNEKFQKLFSDAPYAENLRVTSGWLGEAIAIKDPTAAVFRAQGGANLMILGQNEENAFAIEMTLLLGIFGQHKPGNVKVVVIDGTQDDDPRFGILPKFAGRFPHGVAFPEKAQPAAPLAEVAAEVAKRQKGEGDKTPLFLVIHGMQRFRDLRKADDDFGFGGRGRGEKVASPSDNFTTILREGPPMGVHVVFWCDSMTNLQRCIDRQGMRELGMRVLFQMSQNDSSALIDSPAASRLGRHRGLFITEDLPFPEKFRPYGIPTDEYLDKAAAAAQAKG